MLCRWAGKALTPFLQKSEGDEGLRWRQWQQWVGGCLSVFQQVTQGHQRFPATPVSASLALLSKLYFSSDLHTYLSLYLNYQHLNFCGFKPELGSSRQECPSVDKGLHFPAHTCVFFCSDFLTSTGVVPLTPDLSKYMYTLWKCVSFFHSFLWFLPVVQCLDESCGFTGTRWFSFKWIQTFILILGLHAQKKPVCLHTLQIHGLIRCFPSSLNFIKLELCTPAGRCMWRAVHSSWKQHSVLLLLSGRAF